MKKDNSTPLIVKLSIIVICSLIVIAVVEFTSNKKENKVGEVGYYDYFDKM
tara:strand:- start:94 stop:246 length:153 start_codon:yes stop_codon:yes gene_type:complete